MSKPPHARYRTTNWKSYNAALAQRGSLQVWFDPGMQWLAPPTGKRGRQPVFSDAAIQACLTLKGVFKLPLRQTTGMVASLLEMAGLDWPVPDFSTLSRRQKTLLVEIPCQPSSGPLHLLIDSTGIKAVGDGEWCRRKHGPSKRRQWRKVHLGVDLGSLEIHAIEVTGSRVGDAPMLPELLEQIPPDQAIASVSADGAFDTRACHEAIAARDAYAIIPARSNAQAWPESTPGVAARNEIVRSSRRFGRTIWKRWSGYHQRSLVETKMHCFKLLGERIMARDFDRQVAEMQIRAAILNRFTALGRPQTQRVA
ncbi:IS5 family transposase [Novosphingobium profundi]|uniref:IS5 family transposase n=1 Tax=Novosphingobium profundi TaxID=1774954 RepID=UPI001BDB44C6|nr:IS5 family transposase [Novosphingobium profundi]MBT0671127.1 IS5 family transposase [Novosphingobium profundi]